MRLLKKEIRGAVALEATLTLPIVCCLMFFILEMTKMNDAQTSIDSMAIEMALNFMASKNTNEFSNIISKHKPSFISVDKITWYFDVYVDLKTMNSAFPYGGEEVFWPSTGTSVNDENEYVDSDRDENFTPRAAGKYLELSNYKTPQTSFSSSNENVDLRTLGGKAFVLTVVCDYPFSSSFVQKIFAGGKNTKGSKFLIWGRCVGVCN